MRNILIPLFCLIIISPIHAASIENRIKKEIMNDLATGWPADNLANRQTITGSPVSNHFIEYWIDMECQYCNISEPLLAVRKNPGLEIVIRHRIKPNEGESLKKALTYEALKIFSINAANQFWHAILPKKQMPVAAPYASSLATAMAAANIDPESFAQALAGQAIDIIQEDMKAASRISSTPTYVIGGIRFTACDFTADELLHAYTLAIKARSGNKKAIEKIIQIIKKEQMEEI